MHCTSKAPWRINPNLPEEILNADGDAIMVVYPSTVMAPFVAEMLVKLMNAVDKDLREVEQ